MDTSQAHIVELLTAIAAGSGGGGSAGGEYNVTPPTLTDGATETLQVDVNGYLKVREQYAALAEDNTAQVFKVEHRYAYGRVTADGQIKGSAGFLHTVTFSATGTVTAGVITIYDSLTETGTVIWSGTIQTGVNPTTIILDVSCSTGIYVGYDGTIANVATTTSYR